MINKKVFLISLVTVLLAGVIAFYACNNNDDPTPAEEGKKAAHELCDCLNNAQSEQAEAACFTANESKYQKYASDQAFEDAYNQGIANCSNIPDWWLGEKAAQELCDCFSNASDFMEEMACMMGLMAKYSGKFRDTQGQGGSQIFEEAFSNQFMQNCGNIPDWFICMWAPELCDTGEDLAELGIQAAEELCECFATAAGNEQAAAACVYGLAPYMNFMTEEEFTGVFFGKVGESCPEALALLSEIMGGGE